MPSIRATARRTPSRRISWNSTSVSERSRNGDPGGAKLVGERAVAVDLAVEDERIAARRVDARLGAAGEIDDREPGVPKRDAAVDKNAVAVGSAMRQRAVHRRQH